MILIIIIVIIIIIITTDATPHRRGVRFNYEETVLKISLAVMRYVYRIIICIFNKWNSIKETRLLRSTATTQLCRVINEKTAIN